jgi:hypothetical protein
MSGQKFKLYNKETNKNAGKSTADDYCFFSVAKGRRGGWSSESRDEHLKSSHSQVSKPHGDKAEKPASREKEYQFEPQIKVEPNVPTPPAPAINRSQFSPQIQMDPNAGPSSSTPSKSRSLRGSKQGMHNKIADKETQKENANTITDLSELQPRTSISSSQPPSTTGPNPATTAPKQLNPTQIFSTTVMGANLPLNPPESFIVALQAKNPFDLIPNDDPLQQLSAVLLKSPLKKFGHSPTDLLSNVNALGLKEGLRKDTAGAVVGPRELLFLKMMEMLPNAGNFSKSITPAVAKPEVKRLENALRGEDADSDKRSALELASCLSEKAEKGTSVDEVNGKFSDNLILQSSTNGRADSAAKEAVTAESYIAVAQSAEPAIWVENQNQISPEDKQVIDEQKPERSQVAHETRLQNSTLGDDWSKAEDLGARRKLLDCNSNRTSDTEGLTKSVAPSTEQSNYKVNILDKPTNIANIVESSDRVISVESPKYTTLAAQTDELSSVPRSDIGVQTMKVRLPRLTKSSIITESIEPAMACDHAAQTEVEPKTSLLDSAAQTDEYSKAQTTQTIGTQNEGRDTKITRHHETQTEVVSYREISVDATEPKVELRVSTTQTEPKKISVTSTGINCRPEVRDSSTVIQKDLMIKSVQNEQCQTEIHEEMPSKRAAAVILKEASTGTDAQAETIEHKALSTRPITLATLAAAHNLEHSLMESMILSDRQHSASDVNMEATKILFEGQEVHSRPIAKSICDDVATSESEGVPRPETYMSKRNTQSETERVPSCMIVASNGSLNPQSTSKPASTNENGHISSWWIPIKDKRKNGQK